MSRAVSLGDQLIDAVRMNNVENAEKLIIRGADVNYEDDFGTMPLFFAIREKSIAMAEMLIKHGANINIDHGVTPLIHAIDIGSIRMVKLLIDEGANINYVSRNGLTSLTYALYIKSDDRIAEILIEHGADVNYSNFKGETPLMIACNNGNEKLIHLLLSKGANPDAKNTDGNTAFNILKEKHRTIYDKIKNKYKLLLAYDELWHLTQGHIEDKTKIELAEHMGLRKGGRRKTKRRKSVKRTRTQRKL